jgi:hypothetical protein
MWKPWTCYILCKAWTWCIVQASDWYSCVMCLWIWAKTFISNMTKTFICAYYIILCLVHWWRWKHMKYWYVLSTNYMLVAQMFGVANKITMCENYIKYWWWNNGCALYIWRVTSPIQWKGNHIQILIQSIHPNRKWDGSNPNSFLQPNRKRSEPILTTKQVKSWSRP